MQKNLETERLFLRSLRLSDAEKISMLRSDPSVNQYLNRAPRFSFEESMAFIEKINANCRDGKCYYWAIEQKTSPGLIGTICIWNFSDDRRAAEIGYELIPGAQKKGFMREAVAEVTKFCLAETSLVELIAYTHPENRASSVLLESHQFIFGGRKTLEEGELLFYKRSKNE
jgi:ribosomal-protein-alanine N-acetyltransferase